MPTGSSSTDHDLVLFLVDLVYAKRESDDAPRLEESINALIRKRRSIEILYHRCIQSMSKFGSSSEQESKKDDGYWRPEIGDYEDETIAYLECFHYFVRSLFDMLARITWYIYKDETPSLPEWKFNPQRKYFTVTDRNCNPAYTSLIERSEKWVDVAFDDRDSFAHFFAPSLAFDNGFSVIFEHRRPKMEREEDRQQFSELEKNLKDTMINLDSFLNEFVRVHRNRVPKIYHTSSISKENARNHSLRA